MTKVIDLMASWLEIHANELALRVNIDRMWIDGERWKNELG